MDRLLAPDRLAIETVIATSKPIPNRGAMATRLRGTPSTSFGLADTCNTVAN
jgi:hypothetical protein